jgi:hypothetical protein
VREHELDQILSEERDVVPSTKFTKSVMDAVRLEAAAPPPLAFPWIRALPGFAAGIFASMWIFIEGFRLYEPQKTELQNSPVKTRLFFCVFGDFLVPHPNSLLPPRASIRISRNCWRHIKLQ